LKGGKKEIMKLRPISNKRGQINSLAPSILALVFAAVVLVLGLVITQELRDTQDVNTEAYNASNLTVVGLGTFADFWEIIVLAIITTVVIGLLLAVFGGRRGR